MSFRGGRLAVTPIELDSVRAKRRARGDPRRAVRGGQEPALECASPTIRCSASRPSCARPTSCWPSRARRPERTEGIYEVLYEAQLPRGAAGAFASDQPRRVPNLRRFLSALGAFFVVAVAIAALRQLRARQLRREHRRGNDLKARVLRSLDRDRVRDEPGAGRREDGLHAAGLHELRREQSARARPSRPRVSPSTTAAQFKDQCKAEYEGCATRSCSSSSSPKWVDGEAERPGHHRLRRRTPTRTSRKAKKQSFPKEADFQEFLKTSGMTLGDAKVPGPASTVYRKIRETMSKGVQRRSPTRHLGLLHKNRSLRQAGDARPARHRHEDRGLAPTRPDGAQAGESWKIVAQRVLDRPGLQEPGRLAAGIAKGTQEKSFDEAIFGAQKGELTGPIKTQFGYYVFQVQKIVAASQQSQKEATPAIKQLLDAQNKQKADESSTGPAQEVEGADELRRRLRHDAVQERAGAEDDHRRSGRASPVSRRPGSCS